MNFFETDREIVSATETDFVDVAAVVVMDEDTSVVEAANATNLGFPFL